MEFQSTRPVWGATSRTDCIAPCSSTISIHAPRVGRDLPGNALKELGWEFQSTRPVWGATTVSAHRSRLSRYFNPRAPCGARPSARAPRPAPNLISIHAPRVGRDTEQAA